MRKTVQFSASYEEQEDYKENELILGFFKRNLHIFVWFLTRNKINEKNMDKYLEHGYSMIIFHLDGHVLGFFHKNCPICVFFSSKLKDNLTFAGK